MSYPYYSGHHRYSHHYFSRHPHRPKHYPRLKMDPPQPLQSPHGSPSLHHRLHHHIPYHLLDVADMVRTADYFTTARLSSVVVARFVSEADRDCLCLRWP